MPQELVDAISHQDYYMMVHLWNSEIARAIAQHASMPGALLHEFVNAVPVQHTGVVTSGQRHGRANTCSAYVERSVLSHVRRGFIAEPCLSPGSVGHAECQSG